jgi:hypothetical protein
MRSDYMRFICCSSYFLVQPSHSPRSSNNQLRCRLFGPSFEVLVNDYCSWYWQQGNNLPRRSTKFLAISPFYCRPEHVLELSEEFELLPYPPDAVLGDLGEMEAENLDAALPVPPFVDRDFFCYGRQPVPPQPQSHDVTTEISRGTALHRVALARLHSHLEVEPRKVLGRQEPIITRGRRAEKVRRSLGVVQSWPVQSPLGRDSGSPSPVPKPSFEVVVPILPVDRA